MLPGAKQAAKAKDFIACSSDWPSMLRRRGLLRTIRFWGSFRGELGLLESGVRLPLKRGLGILLGGYKAGLELA